MIDHPAGSVPGGGHHHHWPPSPDSHNGLGTLSNSELQAAQNALSRIASSTGSLGGGLSNLSLNATSIGGSVRASSFQASGSLQGSGSDTFIGGARSNLISNIGTDTVVGGSAKPLDGNLSVLGTQSSGSFALSMDTINLAGTTALSVKALDPETMSKSHTLAVGDKTTITISGLSAHDITKLSH